MILRGDVLALVPGDVDDPTVALQQTEALAQPILDSLDLPTVIVDN